MEVNPNKPAQPVTAVQHGQVSRPTLSRVTASASFPGSEALNGALQSAPDIRTDQVERGRQLIQNSNYPPPEAIRRISALLAIHWSTPPAE